MTGTTIDEKRIKVLLVEDDEDDYIILRNFLSEIRTEGYDLDWATGCNEALALLQSKKHDVCIMDYRLGDRTGLDLMQEFKQQGYETPIIMLTGQGDYETDIQAMKQGAYDYLEKENLSHGLLERSIRYTIQQFRLLQALKFSQRKLRALSTRILENQENERRLISRELHDSIGADLAAIKYALEQKKSRLDTGASPNEGLPLEQIINMVRRTMEETRNIARNLRPSILDDLGILAAIRSLCNEFQEIYRSITIEYMIDIQEHELPDSLKIVVYRLVQEALNNISKHSRANSVQIRLTGNSGGIELCIHDNGRGFDREALLAEENEMAGLGLQGMKERAELSNGTFEIWSEEGRGTRIRALWPVWESTVDSEKQPVITNLSPQAPFQLNRP